MNIIFSKIIRFLAGKMLGQVGWLTLVYVILSLLISKSGEKERADELVRKWKKLFDQVIERVEKPGLVGSAGPPMADLDSLKAQAAALKAEQDR
jgi:hypothetical protein